uniref:HDC02784 n=1 Tax=Drosophila melanogaster TaxID=7227 RepID=Q6IHB7_DROME|nr:TPA_inf: HDC02784 [Drosophila melanogaster]
MHQKIVYLFPEIAQEWKEFKDGTRRDISAGHLGGSPRRDTEGHIYGKSRRDKPGGHLGATSRRDTEGHISGKPRRYMRAKSPVHGGSQRASRREKPFLQRSP